MRNRIIVRRVLSSPEERYRVVFMIEGDARVYDSVSKHSLDRLISKQQEFTHVYNAELDVWNE